MSKGKSTNKEFYMAEVSTMNPLVLIKFCPSALQVATYTPPGALIRSLHHKLGFKI
jgi:hypothetical protein